MKIAFAIDQKKNQKVSLRGNIAEHFGRAVSFLVYDTELNKFNIYLNPETNGGTEFPPDLLSRLRVNAVICFALGPKAYKKFKDYNIKIYKAAEKNILENIEDFKNNKLEELKSL
jgi:predicted Fe-Mo cluster-binding NifX family protein